MFLQILQNSQKILKFPPKQLYSCESFKALKTATLQNTSGQLPLCFVSFSKILVKKYFRLTLQYVRNSSCKLNFWIVRLSQSLLAYCYLKIPRASPKISVPSVNDHPAIVNIIPKMAPCIQTIPFRVTMVKFAFLISNFIQIIRCLFR